MDSAPYTTDRLVAVVYSVLKTKLTLECPGHARSDHAATEGPASATHRLVPPAAANVRDIRHWLLKTPVQLALAEPAEAMM